MAKRTIEVDTKFFHYSQNNSGGSFHHDDERGIGHHVIVEAMDAKDANRRAEAIGLYFDGDGDCPCCGDRWYPKSSYDKGDDTPKIYNTEVSKGVYDDMWGLNSYVHYMDGNRMTIKGKKRA